MSCNAVDSGMDDDDDDDVPGIYTPGVTVGSWLGQRSRVALLMLPNLQQPTPPPVSYVPGTRYTYVCTFFFLSTVVFNSCVAFRYGDQKHNPRNNFNLGTAVSDGRLPLPRRKCLLDVADLRSCRRLLTAIFPGLVWKAQVRVG